MFSDCSVELCTRPLHIAVMPSSRNSFPEARATPSMQRSTNVADRVAHQQHPMTAVLCLTSGAAGSPGHRLGPTQPLQGKHTFPITNECLPTRMLLIILHQSCSDVRTVLVCREWSADASPSRPNPMLSAIRSSRCKLVNWGLRVQTLHSRDKSSFFKAVHVCSILSKPSLGPRLLSAILTTACQLNCKNATAKTGYSQSSASSVSAGSLPRAHSNDSIAACRVVAVAMPSMDGAVDSRGSAAVSVTSFSATSEGSVDVSTPIVAGAIRVPATSML